MNHPEVVIQFDGIKMIGVHFACHLILSLAVSFMALISDCTCLESFHIRFISIRCAAEDSCTSTCSAVPPRVRAGERARAGSPRREAGRGKRCCGILPGGASSHQTSGGQSGCRGKAAGGQGRGPGWRRQTLWAALLSVPLSSSACLPLRLSQGQKKPRLGHKSG